MIQIEKRSLKYATPFDIAYVCVKQKGICKNCPLQTAKGCAIINREENQDVVFWTRTYFLDEEEQTLMVLYNKIIRNKEEKKNGK